MDTRNPVTINRLDYQPTDWLIDHVSLQFELDPTATLVTSELTLSRNPAAGQESNGPGPGLTLQGSDCELRSVSLDGVKLAPEDYQLSATELHIAQLPEHCVLVIVTCINPESNTALEGLYRSSGNFCTQCEAEGFRKITYYLDRPDVLSVFDVTITADVATCPVMLANGNRVSHEVLEGGRHRVQWHDPHPKPSYLFALVAGDLAHIEDHFTTASGRKVLLQIYVEAHNIDRCDFAMSSLKASMRWDEEVYGLEYDLDCFMIVAVDDFNMGAMENKGLNVFNSRFVLADAQSATDTDYMGVEAVIAHEYFHNWTGNRITCRDWFQLSLKEGLTVFRDQSFSSDRHSATVKRIEDVRLLRARQFAEDSGPMAHPIRPDSYIEINNFYTLTVYEKGAEVIRMLHTLLGPVKWRQAMDVYVERHDGTATTCDAFVDAMQTVADVDLTQFRRWYSTAGTPEVRVSEEYDSQNARFHLTLSQSCPDTPGQSDKLPLHIPVVMGLLDQQGNSLSLSNGRALAAAVDSSQTDAQRGVLLDLTEASQTFTFEGVDAAPVVSLLRGFSAPVKLVHDVTDETLAFLMANDPDTFNRWEAGQRLATRLILGVLQEGRINADTLASLGQAWGLILADDSLDMAFKAEALSLPTIDTLEGSLEQVDYQALIAAHAMVSTALAEKHAEALCVLVTETRQAGVALLDPAAMSGRKLANTALALLTWLPESLWGPLAAAQYAAADNMTDRIAALAALCHGDSAARQDCLDDFHAKAIGNRLVMDKWFAVQATSRRSSIVEDVAALLQHADFEAGNPNRLRSLVASFALNNPGGFHAANGQGYRFLADQVIALDSRNPQVAARLVSPLGHWKRLAGPARDLMRQELVRIRDSGPLSPDVFELVSKALQ
ncbi:aminopeptidase N [Granulosicoccus antarcticus]|uniref:Aminopeptidase N n=1 Tax=Granulosicoccus antarcticus IMCC3135 TaxID=1192854 RepID=A0A2Z2NZI3_9GAMM|nr:aminopeptidase N [Granulosicoccus antarcticus]ASJ76689.1 Aminopeptidase N [Granulosicoccus antarcticus IMCC3135]